jgi:hypothetical protein
MTANRNGSMACVAGHHVAQQGGTCLLEQDMDAARDQKGLAREYEVGTPAADAHSRAVTRPVLADRDLLSGGGPQALQLGLTMRGPVLPRPALHAQRHHPDSSGCPARRQTT